MWRYRGQVAGIDAYAWLYRGSYSCATQLAVGKLNEGEDENKEQDAPTEPYVVFCMQRIELLKVYDITPIFVFDGCPLPAKKAVNTERYRYATKKRFTVFKMFDESCIYVVFYGRTRKLNRERGIALQQQGDHKASHSAFCKAISVSNVMVRALIHALKLNQIKYYIAPYEADAQLAFMSKEKIIDVVITEDSDSLPYGCKTVYLQVI